MCCPTVTNISLIYKKFLLRWVNRKDPDGKNLFAGGFLGLDNIGIFDRSKPLPTGGALEQVRVWSLKISP